MYFDSSSRTKHELLNFQKASFRLVRKRIQGEWIFQSSKMSKTRARKERNEKNSFANWVENVQYLRWLGVGIPIGK